MPGRMRLDPIRRNISGSAKLEGNLLYRWALSKAHTQKLQTRPLGSHLPTDGHFTIFVLCFTLNSACCLFWEALSYQFLPGPVAAAVVNVARFGLEHPWPMGCWNLESCQDWGWVPLNPW
jgi:hypothetical protein